MSKIEQRDMPKYTISDYKLWKGDWELINGHPIAMSPLRTIVHQKISGNVLFALSKNLLEKYETLHEIDWIIDEENIVRPDVIVVCKSEDSEYVTKAPKVIFEVISKSTAHNDRVIKKRIYEEEGVLYYGIVDPEVRLAKLYELKDGNYIKLLDARDDKTTLKLEECNITIDFSKIWKK